MEEAARMKIRVLPPDVNRSGIDFTAESGCGDNVDEPSLHSDSQSIRFGLAGIKNVGRGAVDTILSARKSGEFKSLQDFCLRTAEQGNVTRATMEALIKCGAFTSIHSNRRALMEILDSACSIASRADRDRKAGQNALFGGGKEVRETQELYIPNVPDYSLEEILALEKDLLGIYVSDHPLQKHRARIEAFQTANAESVQEMGDREEVKLGGIITTVKPFTSKRSREPMAFFTLEDLTGRTVAVTVFPSVYREYGKEIKKDGIVLIEGRASIRERVMAEEESGAVEVLAEKIFPVADAVNGNGKAKVRGALIIGLTDQHEPTLSLLHREIQDSPGEALVFLDIKTRDSTIRRRPDYYVDLDRLFPKAVELLGRHFVRIE
jgi:DNA polymerase-3 subunit alpha